MSVVNLILCKACKLEWVWSLCGALQNIHYFIAGYIFFDSVANEVDVMEGLYQEFALRST